MSLATVQERVFNAALSRGLASDRHVMVTLNNDATSYKDVRFVVSHTEPHAVASPLNVLWIVADPASPDNGKVLRRSSRTASETYTHSWSEVTQETSLYVPQIWDLPEPEHQVLYDHAALIGNAHDLRASDLGAVSRSGDGMFGPFKPRAVTSGEQYAMDEVVPRSWIETTLGPMRSMLTGIQRFFTNLNNQLSNLRSRTTELEARATSLEESAGARGFSFTQETEAEEWVIEHNLESVNVLVQAYEEEEVVWPAKILIESPTTVRLTFAVPVAGRAEVLPIM